MNLKGRRTRRLKLAAIFEPYAGLWVLTVAILALVSVWLPFSSINLRWGGIVFAGLFISGLLLLIAVFSVVWPKPELRAMTATTAILIAFTITVGVLQYLLTTFDLPRIDRQLATIDQALGFDWRGHVLALDKRPWLARVTGLAYHSSIAQVAVVVIALSATGRFRRLKTYAHYFVATLLPVVAVSSLLPAAGAYVYYDLPTAQLDYVLTVGGTWHLDALSALRDGNPLSIGLSEVRGLATFPSFHVVLAIITAWALWPVRYLGFAACLLNATVVVATVSAGGHYLADIVAGAGLALIVFAYRATRCSLGVTGRVEHEPGELARHPCPHTSRKNIP